ncbi:MAG: NADH-quinone oxidoreductase subunit I, partial [Acidimicrobiaceae bacterium]|nr:NADH-quinone oxidoreductase subunit I [Acidimicrobiaceae bacterium]
RPGEDEHTSAWMRATSPSGAAEYVGKVAWSGELGYGIRAPEAGQTSDLADTDDDAASPHQDGDAEIAAAADAAGGHH